MKKFIVGEQITVKKEVECYYYNYPRGKNLVKLQQGQEATIKAFPIKTTKKGKFVLLSYNGEQFGTEISNIIKVK